MPLLLIRAQTIEDAVDIGFGEALIGLGGAQVLVELDFHLLPPAAIRFPSGLQAGQ